MHLLSDCEKYNIVQPQLEPLVSMIKNMSSKLFYSRVDELQQAVQKMVDTWALSATTDRDASKEQFLIKTCDYDSIILDLELDQSEC